MRRLLVLALCVGAAVGVNSATSAHCVDGDTGRDLCTVKVHVAGPLDNGYHAQEDTAWCEGREVSYTANPDGSGTVECAR